MTQTPRVPVNGRMLAWARERMGLDLTNAGSRLKVSVSRLASWENNEAQPTLVQLRNAAALYRQTVAFFLRQEPPEVDQATRPPDFRTRQERGQIPLGLMAEIDKAAERREVFVRLADVEPFAFPESDLRDIADAASRFRALLGVTVDAQQRWQQPTAFRHWTERIERIGVLVFQMSRVEPDECQGFSLFYDRSPVIVLNGADTPQVRTFTLFHEIGHLLHRSGGVCHTQSHSAAEVLCNAFAADFLLPREDFLANLDGRSDPLAQIPVLAARYRVSWSAIAVRLRTIGAIDQATLDEQLAIAAAKAKATREEVRRSSREKKGGPPHHVTHFRNLGPRYVYTVLDAVQDDRISAVDASYYLDSKWSTIRKMEGDLLKRAVDL
jgi:Zn-dependent peptidase ImmA (M78 family)/transcriptional regulator with XRE-family HTH domain